MNSGGRGFKSQNFFAKKFRVYPKRHVPANAAYHRALRARNIFAKQEPEERIRKSLELRRTLGSPRFGMPALDTIFLKEGKTRAFMKIAFFTDTYEPQVNGVVTSIYSEKLSNQKISVIIPTYLEEKYIEKTLRAVRAQSYENFEIIVVDSNSKDRTRAIAKKIADKVINIKKRGVGLARNIGAKAAKGDLLLFLDADTILEKDFLKMVSKAFNDKNVVATSGYIHVKGSLLDKIIFSGTAEISWLTTVLGFPLFYGMCMTVRKDVFEKIGGFDLMLETAEDINLTERARKYGRCILIRNARALTSTRRTDKMGPLHAVYYHITNFFRYKFFSSGRTGYSVAR